MARKPSPKKYYTLLSREPGEPWTIELGDYVRDVVEGERDDQKDDARHDRRKVEFKIITTAPDQPAIDAAVAKLREADIAALEAQARAAAATGDADRTLGKLLLQLERHIPLGGKHGDRFTAFCNELERAPN